MLGRPRDLKGLATLLRLDKAERGVDLTNPF